MDATQVVIHFIGLVLFSTHVTNDPGLHAILPAIHFEPPTHGNPTQPVTAASSSSASPGVAHASPAAPSSSASPGAAHASVSTNIEPHVALLIFHEDVVANDSQWQASTIVSRFPQAATLASWKYVKLTGEHITFIVDSPSNPRAKLPPNMPRLPRLPGATPTGLTSGYQWPYSKAAAVVDIPEGTLSACHATTIAAGRIDTRLTLNATGTLTIVAAKSGVVKTLVLNTSTNPTIYLVNVPPPRVKGTDAATAGDSHFRAYCSMIGKDQTGTCSRPSVAANAEPVLGCEPVFFAPGSTTGGFLEVGPIFSANAECSNTQWP